LTKISEQENTMPIETRKRTKIKEKHNPFKKWIIVVYANGDVDDKPIDTVKFKNRLLRQPQNNVRVRWKVWVAGKIIAENGKNHSFLYYLAGFPYLYQRKITLTP
jgi:hypothetical protein